MRSSRLWIVGALAEFGPVHLRFHVAILIALGDFMEVFEMKQRNQCWRQMDRGFQVPEDSAFQIGLTAGK